MNMVVARARGLIGTRFRLQGRATETGIDCLGLVIVAFGLPVNIGRRNYPMRGVARAEIEAGLAPWFKRIARTRVEAGDLLLLQPGPGVLHLGVSSGSGMIHADVRHGVVERPGAPPWPMVLAFRRRARRA
ncbi:MAG: NlpC/P60 family protein [Sphingomicrobium sp.]